MKIYICIVVLLFTFTLQQSYAQNTDETTLIGTWTFDYESSLKSIQTQGQKPYDKMDATRRSRIEQAFKGRQLIFFEDGTFEQKLTDGRQAVGTWAVSSGILFMTSSKGTDYEYQLSELTTESLILKIKEYGEVKPIFKKWYFTKN